jgi:hypothetical protein
MLVDNKTVEQPITNFRSVPASTLPIGAIVNNRRLSLVDSVLLPEEVALIILKLMAHYITKT